MRAGDYEKGPASRWGGRPFSCLVLRHFPDAIETDFKRMQGSVETVKCSLVAEPLILVLPASLGVVA